MIIDKIQNLKLYEKTVPAIEKIITFIDEYNTCGKQLGKHIIDGDKLYVSINEYTSKASTGKAEAHERYIDLQYILKGTEQMHIAELSALKQTDAYDSARDIAFYTGECATKTVLSEGDFALLFPHDAHIPGVMHEKPEDIKKMVFKIRVGE